MEDTSDATDSHADWLQRLDRAPAHLDGLPVEPGVFAALVQALVDHLGVERAELCTTMPPFPHSLR